jgi:aldose sugar dehydrogenase
MDILYLFIWFSTIFLVTDATILVEYNQLFLSDAEGVQELNQREHTDDLGAPDINDPNLHAELVVEGLELPTTMAFLGSNDMLVLEKDKGTIQRIINGTILAKPLLDVNVANMYERGMLGIAVDKKDSAEGMKTYVFLFFSESGSGVATDGNDDCDTSNYCKNLSSPLGNRLYRYELVDNSLVNPKLLLDLPAKPGADHIGGVIAIGPDRNLYIISGDGSSCAPSSCNTNLERKNILNSQSSNIGGRESHAPDGRGGILRLTKDGNLVTNKGILGDTYPINMYYAYGIRNGFGMDFDPVTGNLWDTENGPGFGDEINLVEPGFNSGWAKVQGMWNACDCDVEDIIAMDSNALQFSKGEIIKNEGKDDVRISAEEDFNLVDFDGKGKYSTPEFVWTSEVAPTSLVFIDSDKYGERYRNDMFVGDYLYGRLYNFGLNVNRTDLVLKGSLEDKVAEDMTEFEGTNEVLFGQGFGGITDLKVSPYDGYLYIVSHTQGKIFRIMQNDS